MQRSALRSIYGGSQPKAKQAAVVTPVLDECDGENPAPSDEDNELKRAPTRHSNNWNTAGNVNRVPQDQDDDGFGVVLQRKSAQYEVPRLAALGDSGPFSNQEHELYQQQPGALPSGSAQKYTVLGQKQKWRKSRAQRSRRLGQTISPVDDTTGADGYDDEENDLENPSSRQSSSSYISVDERLDSHRSYGSQGPPPPPPLSSGRSTSRDDSESSSRYDSDLSTGRNSTSSFSSSSSSTGEVKQRFVVTRQKQSKYAARIHLPGQQNPLYLGRYRNEEAALAACESAYSVITTPRK
ncbi:hypothetical protein Gpo141_00007979 [Globisporangium polare]